MPRKGVITISELVILSIVWSTCQTAWKDLVIASVNKAVASVTPLVGFRAGVLAASIVLALLYAMILLTENVNIGHYKVFELDLK